MGKTTAPKSISEHNLQQGKTTQLIGETAKNVNGPSQSVVDARAQLSAHYVHPKQKNTCAWVNNPTQQEKNRQWRPCVRKNESIFARGCTTNRKDANLQFVGAQQLVGERKKTCVRPKTTQNLCVRERTKPKSW